MGERRTALIILLVFFFVISPRPLVKASEDSWTTLEPMPTVRSGLGVAVVEGKIYVIGGHNYENHLGTNEMYDPATDTWVTKASMLTPRTYFGIAVVDNKIYCIGGGTGVNEVYDPATDTWETKTSMPTPRYALEANVVDGKIYMIGGTQGAQNNKLTVNEVYNPATDSWNTKTPNPTGVESYASAVVDNKIYIIGGATGVTLNQIYYPETDTWSTGASLPTGVDSAAAGVTAGDTATQRIFVIGGKENLDGVKLNQVYDPKTDTWVAGPVMPTARFGLGVAVVNDSLYAIGGNEGWFGTPISVANERYTPASFVPEFPSWIILPLFLTATLFAIVIKKRLFHPYS